MELVLVTASAVLIITLLAISVIIVATVILDILNY